MTTTCIAAESRQAESATRAWLAIAMLSLATFAIVTTEFMPIGLLSQIAAGLQRSSATVGLTVTLYAWIGAASALVCAATLGRLPVRPLLVLLMLVLAASNGIAAASDHFALLLAARAGGAIAHGFFWAMVAAVAVRIAPPGRMGMATSIVFGGITAAAVLGVPLANAIGQANGWRYAFAAIAALCVLTAFLLAITLPRVAAQAAAGPIALGGVLRNGPLLKAYAVALFSVAAHFGAFTYVEPFLRNVPGMPYAMVAPLLFAFGIAGLLGNVLTGLLIDRHLARTTMAALIAMALALLALGRPSLASGIAWTGILLLLWGLAFSVLMVGLQTWVLRAADDAAMQASAIYTAIFNVSSGCGAMLGAWILSRSGLPAILDTAGAALIVALSIGLWQPRKTRH